MSRQERSRKRPRDREDWLALGLCALFILPVLVIGIPYVAVALTREWLYRRWLRRRWELQWGRHGKRILLPAQEGVRIMRFRQAFKDLKHGDAFTLQKLEAELFEFFENVQRGAD